jgi:Divergent InlB B-repeat domain/YDG domain/Bacterial Ig-like domain (group 3)
LCVFQRFFESKTGAKISMPSHRPNRPTVALHLTAFTAIAVIFLSLAAAGTNAAGFSFVDSIRDILGIPAAQTSVLKASPVETNLAQTNEASINSPSSKGDSTSSLTGGGSITSLGSPLTEDFNGLAQTGTANTWTDNTTIVGWYSNRVTYIGDNGNSATGALFSYGSTSSSDRALGALTSGTTATVQFGAKFTNNTGSTITSLAVAYTGEQWRQNTAAQSLVFEYQVGATSLTTGTWIPVSALDFTGPKTGTAGLLDGNAVGNKTAKSSPISVSVTAGQTIWLRWTKTAASSPGLGVDDLSVTATGVTNYTLTYTAGANGTVTGTSPQTVASGGSGSAVTAVPNTGYHFVNWSDASTSNPRTDTNVTGNISVTANFAINTTPTITFGAAPTPTYLGGNFTVSATTTNTDSGTLTYSYVSGPCAFVSGATFSSSGAGPCIVKADGAATTNFTAASAQQTVTIAKANQTITFGALGNKTFGDADFSVSATASSGLTVSFSSQTASVCTVAGTTVHVVTAGTCTIRASQAGDTNYSAAPNVDQSFTINTATQATLTAVATPSTVAFGSTSTLSSTGGSGGGAVTFSSGLSSGCSVTGTTLSVTDASGTCAVTATKAADTNFNLANSSALTVTLQKATATVTFGAAPTPTYLGGNFTVSAGTTNTQDPSLTYSWVSGPCALVSGATFSSSGAGTCVVKADGAATTNYNSATAQQSVTIAKAEQATITAIVTPSTLVYHDTASLSGSGGSGSGSATFSVGASTGCMITGLSLSVIDVSGTCAVTLSRAGDLNYNAATSAPVTVTLLKAEQFTLTVDPVTVTFGSPRLLHATGGSALVPVTFDSTGSTGCTVTSGGIATVTDATGTCTVTATNAGNNNYNPITSPPQSITLAKGDQDAMIAVATPSTVAYGSTSTLSSTGGTTAGAVTFDAGSSTGCSITGTTLSVTNASGTCDITATKAGDNNYNAATSAPLTVTMTKLAAVITFGAAPTAAYPGADFTVSASTTNTDNSGVSYIRVSGPCTPVHGGVFTPTGVGTCVIEADGAASNNFEAAFNTQSVTITGATFTLTVTNGGHGTVTSVHSSSINCGLDCTEDYNAATPVSLTATPDAGYRFDGWTGDCSGTGACNLSMDGARNVGATFVLNDVVLSASDTLPAGTYHDITIDDSHAVITACGDIFVTGTFTLTRGVVTGCGAGTSGPTPTYRILSGGPSSSFVLGTLGTLHIQSPDGITASPAATGQVQTVSRSFSSLASYVYDGGVNQAVGDGLPTTVGNLTISNAGSDSPADNTVTGNGGQAVTGLLDVVDGVYESHSDYTDVTIAAAGTLTLTGPTTVSGNWTNNGGTLTGNFPVTLDGATGQTITGNTTFYALVKSVTAAQTLNFAAGSTTTVSNSLTFNGTAGNLLSLRSTIGGSQWNLIAAGTHTAGYVDVKDSNATGSSGVINGSNSVDSGNNTNWTFNTVTNYTITVTQTANGTITPGTTTVTSGSNATFHIVPNTGYDIATLVVDGVSVPVQSPYTFTNVTANHTLTATYTMAACRTISMPTLSSTTAVPVTVPINTTDVTGGNVISAQFKVTYDPGVITPIAGADNVVVTAGPVLPSGTTIDINRATPGMIEFSINGSTPFSGSGALVNLHMNVIGAPTSSTPLTLTAIDPAFPAIFYNGGTVCATATSGSLSVIANATTTTVTSSPSGTSVYGDNVTFTATVSPAFTGGTVQFLIDGNPAGAPVAVVGGVATFSTTALTVSGSPHTIAGNFSGFSPYAGSNGSTNISITPRPITVTAATDTKVYDGTTSSIGVPTITLGTLANSDTASFTQTFNDKNVGTGKALTLSGTVIDGNGGTNYTVTFVAVNTGAITAKPITVTAVSDSKNYDGNTSSAGAPIVSPALVGTDTGNFIQVFDNRNAGTGKTLIPSGSVTDGNSGGNYNITFVNNTTGTIIKRAITVTAVTDVKQYDGTTASSGTPAISPALIGPDSSGFIQDFDNKNVGTGKTLTASGSVGDGNGGNNYAVTFVANTTGEITARAITVTAVTDTKVYDGTTSSSGTPLISPAFVGGDTALLTQTFGNKNVGSSKTLTPLAVITDGNGGSNYVVTYVNDTTGVITAKPITVTAVSSTKVYDGTATSSGIPGISPALVGSDTSGFIQAFDNKNVGTGKTLTASGSVNDGNSGNNYAVTFVANNTGVITARPITVTAATDSRVYDGTNASAGIPTVTLGSLAVGDTALFTQTFDNKNVGTGKTLTASGVVTDGNFGNNYAVTFVANTTGVITARAITVTAAASTRVYDGTTASAGIPTITLGSLAVGDSTVFLQTFDTRHVGTGKTLTPTGTITDGNGGGNYAVTYAAAANGTITVKSATWTTDPASKTFGDADSVPLTTGSGSGFLPIDGVSATYSRAAGEAASPPAYHITATLSAATGDLSDYSITNAGAEFTINARTLTGRVTYENAASPIVAIPHTTITATGPAPLPLAVQDALDGNYTISGFGTGSYTITPSKAPYPVNINNGIFANDASLISQHVVHLITLNSTQQRAADVSGLGAVTAFDAALIAQYIVGIPNPLNTTGNWVFNPASSSLTVLPNSVRNFGGILMGDVSGDWIPEASRPALANRFTSVRALLTDATAAPGSNVAVPLRIENLGGAGVTAYQFDIEYDPAVISPAAVAATINGTLGQGLSVVSNAPLPGLLKVVVYGALPVSGEGVYVNLQFAAIGGMGSTSPLNIGQFRLNDGTAPVYTINGSVTVGRSDDNAIHGRVMTPTGVGLANARVIATSSTGERFAVLAGSMGYFEFGGLAVNDTYTISVESKRYTFTPRTVSLTSSISIDMIADQ